MKMLIRKIRFFLIIPLIAVLAACGGSSDKDTGTVSLLITDNLTLDYSEVWINLQSVSATDSNGQTAVLYSDTTGQTHNLSQLANIGALVDVSSIVAGSYTSFDIVMANSVDLVDLNGNVTTATFDQTGNPTFSITVAGSLSVDANQVTTLLLDFDLAQFTYDAGTNVVTPVVIVADPGTLSQTVSTVYGEVEAITSSTRFILDPEGDGRYLTVVLQSNSTVTDGATGQVTNDTSGLSVNMHVLVSGDYDPATLTITASDVSTLTGTTGVRHEAEGYITAVSNGVVTINVHEANFRPDGNNMTIDLSNAAFSHGSLSNLATGQKLEIKGNWDGSSFTAVVAEIEGYPSNGLNTSYDDDYAEIKGKITNVDNDLLTVEVCEYEHVSGISNGDSVTIDSSNSWFEHGNAGNLVIDAIIEAKGGMTDATTMEANVIEFDNSCSNS